MATETEKIPDRIKSLVMVDRLEKSIDEYSKEEIKEFPPKVIIGIGAHYAALLRSNLGVKTIEDLSKLDLNETKITNISKKRLEKWILSSSIICKFASSDDIPISSRRICIAGLEAAGKSSLIRTLENQQTTPVNIPTRGAAVENLSFLGLDMNIWDLGGQESFRELYLNSPKQYLTRTMLLIYVIDTQKQERAEEDAKYLDNLLIKFKYLKEQPKLYLVFHKYDPSVDTTFLENSKGYIMRRLHPVLQKHKYKVHKELSTSIFAVEPLVKDFSRIFADVSPVSDILTDSLAYYSEIHDIHASFLITDNGFVASEWTDRLTKERRDKLFLEIMEAIRKELYDEKTVRDFFVVRSEMGGIFITIERLQLEEELSLFLCSVSTSHKAKDDPEMVQLHKRIKPWIKNFFALIQE